jgi:hypothetical protein
MDKYDVSFRISGINLQPDDISRRLGLIPNEYYISGADTYYVKGEIKHHPVSDIGMWSLNCQLPESELIHKQIQHFLAILQPIKSKLLEIKKLNFKIDFFCGYFSYNGQPGLSLNSSLLFEMGSLGIDFELSIYNLETA